MPVGTGSINRAARNSKKTTEVVKNETKVVKDEVVKAVAAEAVATSKPAEKHTEKPASQKKTTAKKTTATKKTTSAKKPTVKPEVTEKAPELRVYGDETVFVVGNECCHLTEELPVHLL